MSLEKGGNALGLVAAAARSVLIWSFFDSADYDTDAASQSSVRQGDADAAS